LVLDFGDFTKHTTDYQAQADGKYYKDRDVKHLCHCTNGDALADNSYEKVITHFSQRSFSPVKTAICLYIVLLFLSFATFFAKYVIIMSAEALLIEYKISSIACCLSRSPACEAELTIIYSPETL